MIAASATGSRAWDRPAAARRKKSIDEEARMDYRYPHFNCELFLEDL